MEQVGAVELFRVSCGQVGDRRPRFTDIQRRRLASAAKKLSRKTLMGIDPIVTPDTLLRWYRNLVSRRYDLGRGRVACRERLGGLLRYYHRWAA